MNEAYERTKLLLKEKNKKISYGLINVKNREIEIPEGFDICLANEIVGRLLDKSKSSENILKVEALTKKMFEEELNIMEGNQVEDDNKVAVGLYKKWRENAYFEGTIPKTASVEKKILYDLILTVETENTQKTYIGELTKIVRNFKNEVKNIYFDEKRNGESIKSVLERRNRTEDFYSKIFENIDFKKIFVDNDEDFLQKNKDYFIDTLIKCYEDVVTEKVQEETKSVEEKESTLSQQFKEIVFLHNEHDKLWIAAHVNKDQIKGFEDIKVSYDECEDQHGIVRQYIYNYLESELKQSDLSDEEQNREDEQDSGLKNNYSEEESKLKSRELTEDENYSEIKRVASLIKSDLENEQDLNHRIN